MYMIKWSPHFYGDTVVNVFCHSCDVLVKGTINDDSEVASTLIEVTLPTSVDYRNFSLVVIVVFSTMTLLLVCTFQITSGFALVSLDRMLGKFHYDLHLYTHGNCAQISSWHPPIEFCLSKTDLDLAWNPGVPCRLGFGHFLFHPKSLCSICDIQFEPMES